MIQTLLLAAALAAPTSPNHARATLVSEGLSAPRNGTVSLALRLELDPHWHCYWRNPGAAGLPPRIEWKSPESVRPDSLRWPLPDTIPVPPLMTYGYSDSVVLPFTATVTGGQGDSLRLEAVAHWQVCKEICLLEKQTIRLTLPFSDSVVPDPANKARFADTPPPSGFPASSVHAALGDSIVVVTLRGLPTPAHARLFPITLALLDDPAPQGMEPLEDGFRLTLRRDPFLLGQRPDSFHFVVALSDSAGNRSGIESRVAFAALAASDTSAIATSPTSSGGGLGRYLVAIVFAFLGGLLLNLMPCVLPVLSLKALDLLKNAGKGRREGLAHASAYTAGVVLSFLALAGILLVLRAGGSALGWGFQMQSPVVVAILSGLMLLIACNLWGVFEPGAGLARLGGGSRAAGIAGSFLAGLAATIVATPCTAPFMGAALGYTLSRPALETLSVFASLGLGLASPMLLFAAVPAFGRMMPRPGAWMETLKQALGFAMAATACWLGWLFTRLSGTDGLALLFGIWLVVSLAAWTLGRWSLPHRAARVRNLARLVSLALLALALALALRARPAAVRSATDGEELWRPGLTEELRASGQPWFLHFTADWCLSCQVNERTAFDNDRVDAAFQARGIRRVKADWTSRDTGIAHELARFGRQGIPFYVLSDGRTETVLPEVVTPGIVLDALERIPPTK